MYPRARRASVVVLPAPRKPPTITNRTRLMGVSPRCGIVYRRRGGPMSTGEFAYIDWLRKRTPAAAGVIVGPGDDTAVLRPPTRPLLVTTDMLLEGSCFLLAEAGPRRVGRKAIAVNLSDVAAMAGMPTAAVVSVGLPRSGG